MTEEDPRMTMTYSNTSLTTFEQCRYKFKLQYVDKIKTGLTSIEAFMGLRVHKALEILYKNLKNGKMLTLEETLKIYDDDWDAKYSDKVFIVKKEFTVDDYRNIGRKCVIDYYKSHHPFDDMNIIGLETNFVLEIDKGIDYYVKIDKLACRGDTFFVCDYKTTGTLMTQEEADSDRQLALYSEWVRRTYSTDDVKLIWHVVRFDHDVVSERTSEQLQQLLKETAEEIKFIRLCNDWSTNPTTLCNYCEYHSMCPEFTHIIKVEQEIKEKHFTEDEGAKLVDELARIEAELDKNKELENQKKAIKEQIALFARQYGYKAVAGTDKQANVTWAKKAKIDDDDVDDVIATLKDQGKLQDYQKFDKLKAEKDIASGNADFISQFAEVSDSSSVRLAKKK